jgi:Cu-Zn family superoxide dismutase
MKCGIGLALGILLLAGGGRPTQGPAQAAQETKARATIIDARGKEIGTATLTQQPNGVLIESQVSGLQQGTRAFHIHQKGVCETPSFESAGGHFNPTDRKHGMEVFGGPHAGDLPNIIVGPDGSARASTLNPYVTLGPGKTSLLGEDGTALVIHAGQDDYRSQPSGDAGNRIACGRVERGG